MRRVLRNPLRCNNRFAVLIVAALAAISTGAQADSSVVPGQNAASTEEVDLARPVLLWTTWRCNLPLAKNTSTLKSDLSTSSLIYLATSVAWYCALANDDECVIDTAVFASSIEDLDAIPDNERDAVYLNIGLLYGLSAAATGDSDLIKDFLNHGFFSTTEHLFFSPVLYIKRAFVAARLHLKVGDEIAANAALDRGLIALASIETARPSRSIMRP
jgi:hypothetical protein